MLVEGIRLPKVAMDVVVLENKHLSDDVKELIVYAPDIAKQAMPGQFVHLKVIKSEPLLRRPISIASVDEAKGTLSLIYRIVGKGTAAIADLKAENQVNCLGPLGHGFDLNCKRPLLIGGGMGIAPLIFLAQRLCPATTSILMGGRNKAELFWQKRYEGLVNEIFITTDDGSLGVKGFTVTLLPELLKTKQYDRIFVCGPEIMMAGVVKIAQSQGIACQVSLEKHMACGLGACLSCTRESKDGSKRKKVCKDGPVFWAQEVF